MKEVGYKHKNMWNVQNYMHRSLYMYYELTWSCASLLQQILLHISMNTSLHELLLIVLNLGPFMLPTQAFLKSTYCFVHMLPQLTCRLPSPTTCYLKKLLEKYNIKLGLNLTKCRFSKQR